MNEPQPWHLRWKSATVQGRSTSYGEAGEGTPFVFLHGWGLRDRTYQRALNRVARLGVRVLAPSLPAFGGTAALPQQRFDLDGYAEWVADFLHTVGVDGEYYLGGHSFGGGVAIKQAHVSGEKCRLLVLINSIGGAVWKTDEGQSRWLSDRPIWDWGIHFPQDIVTRRLLSKVVPVILQDAARNIVRDPVAFWKVATIARTANLLDELEDLRLRGLPVVVMWGNEDKILPAASLDAIVEAVGREAEVIAGSHSWLLEDPDRFGAMMTNAFALVRTVGAHAVA